MVICENDQGRFVKDFIDKKSFHDACITGNGFPHKIEVKPPSGFRLNQIVFRCNLSYGHLSEIAHIVSKSRSLTLSLHMK